MARIEEIELEGHRSQIVGDVKQLFENIGQCSIGMWRTSIKLLRINLF